MIRTYTLLDGTKVVFEYDHNGIGKITLESMDILMSLLKATVDEDEPKTEPQTNKAEKKQPTPILDFMVNGRVKNEPQTMYYPQVDGITPSVIKTEPQTDEEYINNLPWTEAGNGEHTDIEIARAIVHKAIDDTPIAEDAYPDLRQKMHDAVDNYEPQTMRDENYVYAYDKEQCEWSPIRKVGDEPQTDCAWGKGE